MTADATQANWEIGDILRTYGPDYLKQYRASPGQKRVLRELAACRTAALGGHVEQCDACGHSRISYNSCRNRHCPKCQSSKRAEWLEARSLELLDVPYFHVVFTLPQTLDQLALQNKTVLYGILFRAAAETLKQIAADPRHLGAQLGFLAVLHTWGQNLMHHPHVHCVVPGGGLAADGSRWIPCKKSRRTNKEFFLPVRVLSRVFRGKFVHLLRRARDEGTLAFHGQLKGLADPQEFEKLLNEAVRKDWVVYAKRPFGGPRQVLKYLARYTHRVAISNQRIASVTDGQVQFHWKDYADGNRQKAMTLSACEFIRRFLLHVLPSGFMRIRYYGFLSNNRRGEDIALCRKLIGQNSHPAVSSPEPEGKAEPPAAKELWGACPCCGHGHMVIVQIIARDHAPRAAGLSISAAAQRRCVGDTS